MPKISHPLFLVNFIKSSVAYGEKLSNVKIFLTTFSPFGGERFPLLSGVALD
jgi:hypothetical protein